MVSSNDENNKNIQFSVLLSLYIKEKPEYLQQCLASLEKQTVRANEWVIVKDGPLNKGLIAVLEIYEKRYPNLIKYVSFNENQGLGIALREGMKVCQNELVARMDTDDIAKPERFEMQIEEFSKDCELDICGSHIKEFIDDINNVVSLRYVPLMNQDIYEYQRRRSAFNHMTVMFKKSSVMKAGNYEDALLMEDDLLWIKMLKIGVKCKNLNEFLVYARVGKDMINRRGGYSYFKKYKSGRKKILCTGYISYIDYLYTIVIQFFVALCPNKMRYIIFKKLLRKKSKWKTD